LSASISCSDVLAAIRRGERLPPAILRDLGANQPGDFFRIIVEALADSFDPAQAQAYEDLMRAWIAPLAPVQPLIPNRVETVFVLSRVTLGADIKITSVMLSAIKRRFAEAEIVLVGNRKSAGLFSADPRISHLNADYPRTGLVTARVQFAHDLRRQIDGPNRLVIDPDSRMTQLGLIPVCAPEHYFHFPSRTAIPLPLASESKPTSALPPADARASTPVFLSRDHEGAVRSPSQDPTNLTELTQHWLFQTFGESREAYIATPRIPIEGDAPRATVSLGVGENETKRVQGDFEAKLIQTLGEKFRTIWIDRGVGGAESARVTAAAEASGYIDRIRFWEGSFAGFASLISQSDLYTGYDSAGQHAAAATGTPLITIFAGAPSERFRQRWSPQGPGRIRIIDADSLNAEGCLQQFRTAQNVLAAAL
jgi:ADP-heptose:LPS heptosyltransferase